MPDLLSFQAMAKSRQGTAARQNAASSRNAAVQPGAKKVGRPRAKHSSPDYAQMSVYIHKEVRNKVKMRLFETGSEFSGLVESLLRDWLKRSG